MEHNTTPPHGPQPGPTGTDRFFNSIRRSGLIRTEERWVGGVAGGFARRFGLDPLLVRGLLAVSLLIVGTGLVLYAVGWALLPEERDGRIHFEEMIRGNFDGALIGAGIAFVIGLGWGDFPVTRVMGFPGSGALALAVSIAIIAVVVVTIGRSGWNTNRASTPGAPSPGPMAAGPTAPIPTAAGAAPWTAGPVPTTPPTPEAAGEAHTNIYSPLPPQQNWEQPHMPPRPPKEPGPISNPPGPRIVGMALGFWSLTTAALMLAHRAGQFDAPVLVLSLAALIAICGVAIVIAGAIGRTSGALSTIAVLTALFAFPLSIWPSTTPLTNATHGGIGEAVFQPETASEAESGFALLAGDWEVDLTGTTGITDPGAEPVKVPITMAAGDLTVRLPPGVDWRSDVRIGAGEVNISTPETGKSRSGLFISERHLEELTEHAPARVELEIQALAGSIQIIQEDS